MLTFLELRMKTALLRVSAFFKKDTGGGGIEYEERCILEKQDSPLWHFCCTKWGGDTNISGIRSTSMEFFLNVSLNSANSVTKILFIRVKGLKLAISCVRD